MSEGTARVTVRLGHGLRHRTCGEAEREMRVPSGTRIVHLVVAFGLDPAEVSIVSRQGTLSSLEDVVADGDLVELYPPIGGGC